MLCKDVMADTLGRQLRRPCCCCSHTDSSEHQQLLTPTCSAPAEFARNSRPGRLGLHAAANAHTEIQHEVVSPSHTAVLRSLCDVISYHDVPTS
jgi:hypothetical protein